MEYNFLVNLKTLDAIDNNITSLPVLPSNLRQLNCDENNLTSLSNLPGTLKILTCSDNMLSSLSNLPNSIVTLNCSNNPLISLPSSLPSSLVTLYCTNTQLTNLPILPNTLQKLYCESNSLTSITSLPPSLSIMDCSSNSISSITALPASLSFLTCNNNLLTTLPPLPTGLDYLFCNYNLLTSIPAIPASMRYLYCTHNNLDSLPDLSSATTLTRLMCSFNSISTLPSLVSAVEIYCDHNQLTSVTQLPAYINILNCANNSLTTLPPCHINKLYCGNNNITSLNNITVRDYLDCTYNNLITLPASSIPDDELRCGYNPITSLPPLGNLSILNCQNCQLTSLPACNYPLSVLYCNNNQLTSLPFLNDFLLGVICDNNNITNLPTLPTYLTYLTCTNNPIACFPILPYGLEYLNYLNTYVACLPNIPTSLTNCYPNNPFLCVPQSNTCNYSYTRGYIFMDYNGNGVKDSSESGFVSSVYYSNYLVQSDSAGLFTAISDTGNITFQINIPNYYLITTSNPQVVHVTPYQVDTIYIGMQGIPNIKDLAIDITNHSRFRSGFDVSNRIHYWNKGTESIPNVVVKYLKPSALTTISTSPVISGSNGDTLFWNIGNLNPFQDGFIDILDSVSVAAISGTIVNPAAVIEPIIGDTIPFNNHSISYEIVTVSFDPNDKSVKPEFVAPNYNDFFEYLIRFQNTGTDTAFSVLLTDTLSNNLDLSSIEMLSFSHPNTFWIENGTAKWYFANILLPDSNVNEADSHGFVKFKIKPIANLVAGTQIPNSANIYFDYNAAVITNTIVVNVTPLSVPFIADQKMQLFPNPVLETVHLNNSKGNPLGRVELINSEGKILDSKIITTPSFNWQVEQLPVGIYFFKGENWKEKILKK